MIKVKPTSIRLDEDQLRQVDTYAQKRKIDRSQAVREILAAGLLEKRKAKALEEVRRRIWSIWRGAEYAELTYRAFPELLRTENVPFPLTLEDLADEFETNSSEQ